MIELRTLGGLELLQLRDGVVRAIPLQTKRLALLAYLTALPESGFCRRDTLLALFWPELDQEHARGSLRQALHFLRKAIGEGAILSRGEDEVGLDRVAVRSDAQLLEAALGAGEPEAALSFYRGDFLAGVFVADASPDLEDWIAAERVRLRGLAAKAAWKAAERPTGQGNTGGYIRRAVQLSGDDERALRRGFEMLDRMGDHAGATALYEEFADRVARDLEVGLSAQSHAMIEQVRARRRTTASTAQHHATAPRPDAPAGNQPAVDGTAAVSATPVRRAGKRLIVGAAAGVLLTVAVAAYLGSDPPTPSPARHDVVAILPFRIAGADSSLRWLREGIVELLTTRLTLDGGPMLVDPGAGTGGASRSASLIRASRVIEGSVTSRRGQVTLTARVSSGVGGTSLGMASVEGSPDSLPALLDLLAIRLLGLGTGLAANQLPASPAPPLAAMQAFAAGQRAFRAGRMSAAVKGFSDAIALDSTFALAGLQAAQAGAWTRQRPVVETGLRVAKAGRERLAPADQAILDALLADQALLPGPIARWNAVVTAYPERPDAWYALGEAHWHLGALSGEDRPFERAGDAFRRGWLLDSASGPGAFGGDVVAEPVLRMVELAHLSGDTAAVLQMVPQVLAIDSTTDLATALMWHRALVTSESAREAFWSANAGASQLVTLWVNVFITWTGIGAADLPRLQTLDAARLRAHDPGFAGFALASMALNSGRPSEVPPFSAGGGDVARTGPRALLRRALWWDGDTVAALEAVHSLEVSVSRPATNVEAARDQLLNTCTLGEWRARRGDLAAARAASAQLRAFRQPTGEHSARLQRYATICASLLDAMHATGLGLPEARRLVMTADSLSMEFVFEVCCGEAVSDMNLQVAALWEQLGDAPRALAAVRRRSGQFGEAPHFLSTFLREEGRLATMAGDTASAERAYRHYLALRPDPDASLKPGVDSVRSLLAELEAR